MGKTGTGTVTEAEVEVYDPTVEEVEEVKAENFPALTVKREAFMWKGEKKFAFKVHAVLRGENINIELAPFDLGGYKAANMAFGKLFNLPLSIKYSPFKDKLGRVKVSYEYGVRSEDGILFAPLQPRMRSDGTFLEMLIAQTAYERKKASEGGEG